MAREMPKARRRGGRHDFPATRQPGRVAEQSRRQREADLVAVDCRSCGELLATVVLGAEAFCRTCGVWTSSVGGPSSGGQAGSRNTEVPE